MEMLMVRKDFICKHLIFLVVSCIISQPFFAQQGKKIKNSDSLIAKIDIQKGFHGDTISLKLNNYKILNRVVATSHAILENTGINIEIYYLGTRKVKARFMGKTKKLKLSLNNTLIEVRGNTNHLNFPIDLSKGKFIGISMAKSKAFEFVQSKRRFFYD
ncbi:MAG TPA: hypothetical protein PKA77_17855 [Chitinophagaceae bacterium]|jgi:hypothetical protein|nr:hypothetical protein [Chitinophagaceae bacterium]